MHATRPWALVCTSNHAVWDECVRMPVHMIHKHNPRLSALRFVLVEFIEIAGCECHVEWLCLGDREYSMLVAMCCVFSLEFRIT